MGGQVASPDLAMEVGDEIAQVSGGIAANGFIEVDQGDSVPVEQDLAGVEVTVNGGVVGRELHELRGQAQRKVIGLPGEVRTENPEPPHHIEQAKRLGLVG